MSLGERICKLRTDHGMSQYALAKAMGISRQAVSKWETDLSTPNSLKLIQLAELLDTDIEYLTTGRIIDKSIPVVINQVEKVETVVEKPVIEYIEKPVVKKIYRTQYIRNPIEYILWGAICFLIGLFCGLFL